MERRFGLFEMEQFPSGTTGLWIASREICILWWEDVGKTEVSVHLRVNITEVLPVGPFLREHGMA